MWMGLPKKVVPTCVQMCAVPSLRGQHDGEGVNEQRVCHAAGRQQSGAAPSLRLPISRFVPTVAALSLALGLGAPAWAQSLAPASSLVTATPAATLPVLPDNDPAKNYMGLNTWFLNDWDGSFAFVDAMKHARAWQDARDWNKAVAGIDALGWPTADASTVVYTGSPAQVNGTYKLIFNGQADVSLLWYPGSVSNKVYDPTTNTTTADVTYKLTQAGSGGLIFRNTRRTPQSALNSGFTNVRLYRPNYPADGSVLFTKDFLAAMGRTSVVRMMEWSNINQNLVQHWADRRTPLHMSKAGTPYMGPNGKVWSDSVTGVALEYQIQLCNTLKSDCWINIPAVADDDYVQKTALALRYGTDGTNPYSSVQANPAYPPLNPNLHLYVEYANETWNSAGGFYSYRVIQDIVGALPAGHEVLTPPEPNFTYNVWRYPAYRLAAISNTFRSVYGDASMMNRVRPVLMTQQGNAQRTLAEALIWLDAYGHRQTPPRDISYYVYGAGGSGYYYVNSRPIPIADQGNADLFFAPGNYPATPDIKAMGVDAIWAANYGLKRVAYEGGPSLVDTLTGKIYAAQDAKIINADPRMQDMVVKTHDAWSGVGGDLLVYYAVRGPTSWEFTPDISTIDTPKFRGLDQLYSQPRVPVTLGQQLPGTIIATEQIANRIRNMGYEFIGRCDSLPCLGGSVAGNWLAFPGHASKAFAGDIMVTGSATVATTLNVLVNGVNKGQVVIAPGGHLNDTKHLAAMIPAGLVAIRLEVVSGAFNLRSITVNGQISDAQQVSSEVERVMNWLESSYPQYFSPKASTQQIAGYAARAYGNGVYLAASNGDIYVYGPDAFGPQMLNVGPLFNYLAAAVKAGF